MFAAPTRASLFIFLVSLCSAALTQAQIHEEKPAPGLDKGVLMHLEKSSNHNKIDAAGKTIGAGDFSVVCRLALPAEIPALPAAVGILTGSDEVASHDRKTGWKLFVGPDHSLSLFAQTKEGSSSVKIDTLKDAVRPGKDHDIVISVHRDARQPLSGIWVDGIELASGTFAPLDLRASLPGGDWDLSGWAKSVTVYDRALTRPEIVELTLRTKAADAHLPKPAHPAPTANGPRFVPQENETIALIGGTEAVALAESGQLEAMLLLAFPQTRFHFRNLAWEGDTVFRQDRPMNFGTLEQQLRRVNAGTVFVMFGRQECLDAVPGETGIPEFKKAFETLLSNVRKVTPNIVMIAPPQFEEKAPPLPDLSRANEKLVACKQAMREVADKLGAVYAESFFRDDVAGLPSVTSDGVQVNPEGLRMMTDVIATSLHLPGFFPTPKTGRRGILKPGEVDVVINRYPDDAKQRERLCTQLGPKNRLWHDYWRPSNWAFLYGDRTNQPSSRDPVNSQIRLFPAEQETILPMIKAAEEKIYRVTEDMQKRLP